MICTIAYDKIAFTAGPFCDLQNGVPVVDIYVGF